MDQWWEGLATTACVEAQRHSMLAHVFRVSEHCIRLLARQNGLSFQGVTSQGSGRLVKNT